MDTQTLPFSDSWIGLDEDAEHALRVLARRRIYFAHQSVGAQLLDGVRQMLEAAPTVPLRIVEYGERGTWSRGTIVHDWVGTNGHPADKIADFAGAVRSGVGDAADLVSFKFCYADFDAGTPVLPLFERYGRTLAALRREYPRVAFVHTTVPLTTVQHGAPAIFARVRGPAPWGAVENAKRGEFNALMRASYGDGEPLFDLAALEATGSDGRPFFYRRADRDWPALPEGSTPDGGHLTRALQGWVARKWVEFLAEVTGPA